MPVILLDPDIDFCELLAADLRAAGLGVRILGNVGQLAALLSDGKPGIVLLGHGPCSENGAAILRQVVNSLGWRCIVLAEDTDRDERASSLELGADDVIERNAGRRELIARIKAVWRRAVVQPDAGWRVMAARRELVRPDGTPVPLTTAEFHLLTRLAAQPGEPVSRETLFSTVFGRGFNPLDRAVDTVVSKLRTKLHDTSPPSIIRTVRPVGYVFTGFAEMAGER